MEFREHDSIEDNSGSIDKLDTNGNGNVLMLKNVSMNYGFNKRALWDLTFGMKPGEKIGLVGMPNSGKHSIFNLLLKLYPVSNEDGKLLFYGKDISKINTKFVRKHIGY